MRARTTVTTLFSPHQPDKKGTITHMYMTYAEVLEFVEFARRAHEDGYINKQGKLDILIHTSDKEKTAKGWFGPKRSGAHKKSKLPMSDEDRTLFDGPEAPKHTETKPERKQIRAAKRRVKFQEVIKKCRTCGHISKKIKVPAVRF